MKDNIEEEYLFCYLDILGYSELVNTVSGHKDIIGDLKSFINFISSRMFNSTSSSDNVFNQISKSIDITIISDSILIRLPLKKLPLVEHITNENDSLYFHIQTFFVYITWVFIFFPIKIGYFVRGGVSIDMHYEEELGSNNLFVFSKALIDAYLLEQKSEVIRILVSEKVINYLDKNFSVMMKQEFIHKHLFNENFVNKDGVNRNFYCVEIYDVFYNDDFTGSIFKDLQNVVIEQMKKNKDDKRIQSKYEYFIEYHNSRIDRYSLPKIALDKNGNE